MPRPLKATQATFVYPNLVGLDNFRDKRPARACDIDTSLIATSGYHSVMRSVAIKALNSRLSEYVRLAASGETVLITDRDRVVAVLGPPLETRSPILADAMLAEAVRSGDITPPLLPATTPPPRSAAVMTFDEVMAELDITRGGR